MNRNTKNFAEKVYKEYKKEITVYLKGAEVKSVNFDKYTNTGYTVSLQNPLFIKAIVRDAKPEELITKNIGLVAVGAKKLTIKENEVSLIKNSARIVIDDEDYYVYSDAVGNKIQITSDSLGYYVVYVFKKEI